MPAFREFRPREGKFRADEGGNRVRVLLSSTADERIKSQGEKAEEQQEEGDEEEEEDPFRRFLGGRRRTGRAGYAQASSFLPLRPLLFALAATA